MQKQKDSNTRLSYKPSIMTDESGLIVGQRLHPTNEIEAVEPLLEQYESVFGQMPQTTMLDGGYNNHEVLNLFFFLGLNILCPSGRAMAKDDWRKRGKGKQFHKEQFIYDEQNDVYRCPANKTLVFEHQSEDKNGHYRRFRGHCCQGCDFREQCTAAVGGRTIKRYDGDELKDAMAEVMKQPQARKEYRSRKTFGERPFAELKCRQGLTRFHRRGQRGARVEFSLHCMAANLKMACRGLFLRIFTVHIRLNGGPWRLLGASITIGHRFL
jgi:hypothetical protein